MTLKITDNQYGGYPSDSWASCSCPRSREPQQGQEKTIDVKNLFYVFFLFCYVFYFKKCIEMPIKILQALLEKPKQIDRS